MLGEVRSAYREVTEMTIDLFVDESGCIHLPKEAMAEMGISPGSHVLLDVSPQNAVIKPFTSMTPIPDQIGSLSLPVKAWDEMKTEIIAAHLRI